MALSYGIKAHPPLIPVGGMDRGFALARNFMSMYTLAQFLEAVQFMTLSAELHRALGMGYVS